MTEILTKDDAMKIAAILDMAIHGRKIARIVPDDAPVAGGLTVYGVARHISDPDGRFWPSDKDVRDAYLHVTSRSGWELFWPIRELLKQDEGTFVAYDW